jgi:hypothetical protein
MEITCERINLSMILASLQGNTWILFLTTMMATIESLDGLGALPKGERGTILQICDCNSHGRPKSIHLDHASYRLMRIHLR